MAIPPEKKDRICRAYRNLMSLLQEGESASSVLEMIERGDPLKRWEEPSDDTHMQRVYDALDELLDLAEVTECYRDHIRNGVYKIYGPNGAPPNFLMALISGGLHMMEKPREIETFEDLLAAIPVTDREIQNLLTTGMRNYDPENLTMDLYDPEKSEILDRKAFSRYENANRHIPKERRFIRQWRIQLDKRYRSSD